MISWQASSKIILETVSKACSVLIVIALRVILLSELYNITRNVSMHDTITALQIMLIRRKHEKGRFIKGI